MAFSVPFFHPQPQHKSASLYLDPGAILLTKCENYLYAISGFYFPKRKTLRMKDEYVYVRGIRVTVGWAEQDIENEFKCVYNERKKKFIYLCTLYLSEYLHCLSE